LNQIEPGFLIEPGFRGWGPENKRENRPENKRENCPENKREKRWGPRKQAWHFRAKKRITSFVAREPTGT
jgi:hypothetical protein